MATNLQQFVTALLGHVVRTHVEPKVGLPLWDNGLGTFTQGLVASSGIPAVTGDEIAGGVLNVLGMGKQPRRGGLYRPIRRVQLENGKVIDVKAEAA
jgi:hypothetical protein